MGLTRFGELVEDRITGTTQFDLYSQACSRSMRAVGDEVFGGVNETLLNRIDEDRAGIAEAVHGMLSYVVGTAIANR